MIVKYSSEYEKAWDTFILNESINGTFLQSRVFLNYHPDGRFRDNSLMFMKGNNIIAVIPANVVEEDGKKSLVSHAGSTFGGIVLGKHYKKVTDVEQIFSDLQEYLQGNGFDKIILKMTSNLYAKEDTDLLDYFLFLNGYQDTLELGYYINFEHYDVFNIESNFNASRRRGWKNSLKQKMEFRELITNQEIRDFYDILANNMEKFNTKPVHTLEELVDLKQNRLCDMIRFYGVYFGQEMVAGSMVFAFDKKVFHTQYLATNQDKLSLYPSEYLYYELIKMAIKEGFSNISFGTSTLEHGYILNRSLAMFKEGFGTLEYVNRTYTKTIKES